MMRTLLKRIKNKLIRIWWRVSLRIASAMPLQNVILFESVPDMADNTGAVFDECIRRKLNRKYVLVWMLTNSNTKIPKRRYHVRYCDIWGNVAKFYSQIAKVKISCNIFLCKNRPEQFCFYLSHGIPIKSTKNYYSMPAGIDCLLTASEQVVDIQVNELSFDRSKTVALGFPRNDVLCREPREIRSILNTTCKTIIVWYPTYRQHRGGTKTGASHALPVIHTPEFAETLNEAAKRQDVLIVLKPHFVQDVSYIQDLHLSNIRFIDDAFFFKHNLRSYEFVGACDALITDYSSIYYDFTLCDKPIAAIWEDIEEYKQNPGLVENYEHLMKGAEKIYTLEDLVSFIQRVGNGIDLLQSERREIRDFANYATDGKSSERVVDFLVKKLNEKDQKAQ